MCHRRGGAGRGEGGARLGECVGMVKKGNRYFNSVEVGKCVNPHVSKNKKCCCRFHSQKGKGERKRRVNKQQARTVLGNQGSEKWRHATATATTSTVATNSTAIASFFISLLTVVSFIFLGRRRGFALVYYMLSLERMRIRTKTRIRDEVNQ